ncbi:hypothetical protein RSL75_004327 [Salmonella enterica]|nr:hypothetical protein [Salmonella enterica]EJT7258916.1 hypothetical protein [Salmonella enterica]ELI8702684.1 hypothetical protein [Salmonella enterica]
MFLYRSDYRAPSEIFMRGFQSWGNNDNLLWHVRGLTIATINNQYGSAFISTSTIRQKAIDFNAHSTNSRDFYIYEISSSGNFFSVKRSFQSACVRFGEFQYFEAIEQFGRQDEYVAFKHITPGQIFRATRYIYNHLTGIYQRAETRKNARYSYSECYQVNTEPYPHMVSALTPMPPELGLEVVELLLRK